MRNRLTSERLNDFFGIGGLNENTGRQPEIDLVKGVTVIIMLFSHSYGTICFSPSAPLIIKETDELFAGCLGASVFMLCMGLGFVYSRTAGPKQTLRRGLVILLLGLAMNAGRAALPYIVSSLAGKPLINLGWGNIFRTEEFEPLLAVFETVVPDILQFAGLTMLCFALFFRLKLSPGGVFAVGLVSSALSTLIGVHEFDSIPVSCLSGYIIMTDLCTFSLLSWLIWPCFGYFLGSLLIRVRDKDLFYRRLLQISAPFVIIYAVIILRAGSLYPLSPYNNEYYSTFIEVLFLMPLCTCWLCLWYRVSKLPGRSFTMLSRFSRNLNLMYLIHWVILGFVSMILITSSRYYGMLPLELTDTPKQLLPAWVAPVTAVPLIFVTDFIATRMKSRRSCR